MNHERAIAVTASLMLTVLIWTATGAYAHGPVQDHRQLKYPDLRDIEIPEVERATLSSGMRVLLREDHELPLICISARIRVGSLYEPAEKIGLAAVAGAVMRTGGTQTRTGDELDEELERIAASVETGIGLDSGYASLSVLATDIDTGLTILADVMMHPTFSENKIELVKMQIRSGISRRNDSPSDIASREFGKLIYGPDSVYARQMEYATIDRVTRADLMALHKRYFGPNNTTMAVWGDFTTKEMIEKLEKAFAGWQRVEPVPPEWPGVDYLYRETVSLIRKANINQSSIRLGHIGGLMSDPDYFALTVVNQILCGSLTGRLFKSIRSEQGLAYSVGGSYGMNCRHPGIFSIGCRTKSQSTVRAIRAMVDEICRIRQEQVSDEELALAKESYLNSFVFNFDTTNEIVTRVVAYEYYGYPADFLQRTKRGIEQVTKADVLQAAQKHLRPDKLQILVVGRPEDFDEPLSVLGLVNEIDIAILGSEH
ncbi:M16 family metallopeptidase [Petrachloros mirabilis]